MQGTKPLQRWAAALVLGLAGVSAADQPKTRARQLDYDPQAGGFVEAVPPVEGTPLGDLQLARQALGREDHGQAYRRVKRWLKVYGLDHELSPEARLLRAEVQIARRDYYKAHKHLQEFQGEFAGTEFGLRAAAMEFVIAEVFLSGTKRKFLGMRLLKGADTGIDILDQLSNDYPDTTLAEMAIKTKADFYYRQGDFALAELEYSRLVREFPRSRYVRLAARKSADATLASFPGIEFDDAALIEAEERFTRYLAQYGAAARQEGVGQILQEIRATRADKEHAIGRYYQKTKHLNAAIFYYRSTCRNWPDSTAAIQARQRLAQLGALDQLEAEQTSYEAESGS